MKKIPIRRLLASKSRIMLRTSKKNSQKHHKSSHSSIKPSHHGGAAPTSFIFTVNELHINDDTQQGGIIPEAQYGRWIPPLYSAGFSRSIGGRVYRWMEGAISNINTDYINASNSYARHTTSSVFYCDQMLPFHVGVCDPTRHNMAELEQPYHRWYPLSFHNNPGISRVDIAGTDYYLPGAGTTWVTPLGLDNYCYANNLGTPTPQGLAGNLGILIALIAFSCEPEHLDQVLTYHRAWDNYRWTDHPYQHGSKHAIGPKSYEY